MSNFFLISKMGPKDEKWAALQCKSAQTIVLVEVANIGTAQQTITNLWQHFTLLSITYNTKCFKICCYKDRGLYFPEKLCSPSWDFMFFPHSQNIHFWFKNLKIDIFIKIIVKNLSFSPNLDKSCLYPPRGANWKI